MVKSVKMQEKLTYSFTDNINGTALNITWDEVEVSLPIIIK